MTSPLELSLPRGESSVELAISGAAVKGTRLTWVRGETIGRGSMGSVFKALDQSTGQIVAIKEMPINTDDENDVKLKKSLENEIDFLKDLKHPNIVSYLGHEDLDGCLYLYLEYVPGGSLSQVLKQFGAFDEDLILGYSHQILQGLGYLHGQEPPVVHRDLKGGNILVGVDGILKLADFGCSKRIQDPSQHTNMRGSVPWMAPEVIRGSSYSWPADIWSFGCVVVEMGTARVPWGKFDNQMAAMVKIGMTKDIPPLPDDLSENCTAFILSCLQREPGSRPSAADLLAHELLAGREHWD